MLAHVPYFEFERIRALDGDPHERAAAFADACRLNALYMIQRAGSGHPGTTFSSLDIVSWLHLGVLDEGDRYFSSKGHDAPGLYAVLAALGRLDFELIHQLRRLDGLPGHPDVAATPEVVTSTGSLGMGISKARGFVLADRLLGRSGRVYVLTGDGELQEGQFWESLQQTANRALHEITVIVDRNQIQSDTWVSQVSDHGDLEAKIRTFGWAVARCDGHDIRAFAETLDTLESERRPKLVIAETRKGAGVSFMEPHELAQSDTALYGFHSGAPTADEYERALEEIRTRLDASLERLGTGAIELVEAAPRKHRSAPSDRQRLVPTYGEALVAQAEREPRLVALDADLRLDCGLVEFRERYPDRFFECGIAEQDMVSQAGAMALAGLIPVVHSFACFLSTRPNEQIYNNATERTKVIYVGSLAGIVPGGPGHSHQSVRDISALGSMPGMALLEPFSESEVRAAVDWAVHHAPGSVYLRLVSVPWALGFDPPEIDELVPGQGTVLRSGADGLFVAAGPVMVAAALGAADILAADGLDMGVAALPWLRDVDGAWVAEVAADAPIFTLDNHYVMGGQGDAILASLAANAPEVAARVRKIGVGSIPKSGGNDEVLAAHGLDAEGIAASARSVFQRV
ncbi:MAG TPA: transketolase C-terminal domain-containing protein [Plantibacter sp.]|uniref:transketolase C-terminal domain-containing protein n=1 Tax=Plantibacter sp. TaxID=1871045 RepID=UPI002CB7E219|nr:transketolase C-terminal domain-containing protein [Plantibacter sp.]